MALNTLFLHCSDITVADSRSKGRAFDSQPNVSRGAISVIALPKIWSKIVDIIRIQVSHLGTFNPYWVIIPLYGMTVCQCLASNEVFWLDRTMIHYNGASAIWRWNLRYSAHCFFLFSRDVTIYGSTLINIFHTQGFNFIPHQWRMQRKYRVQNPNKDKNYKERKKEKNCSKRLS